MKPKSDYELRNILHMAFEQYANKIELGTISTFNSLLTDETPVTIQVSIQGDNPSSIYAEIKPTVTIQPVTIEEPVTKKSKKKPANDSASEPSA